VVVVAAVAGAALLVVTGLPALRIPGFTLSVVTLGVAVVAPVWLFRQRWLGTDTPTGAAFDPPALPRGLGAITDQLGTYYFSVIVLALGIAAAAALQRSVPGRLVVAARDNEPALAAMAVSPASVKLAMLGVSGAMAGAAGVLWANGYGVANLNQFSPNLSIALLAIPVIGGLGSLSGALAGALAVYIPVYFITPHLFGLLGPFSSSIGFLLLLGGLGQVMTVRSLPDGIAGAVQRRWQRWLDARTEPDPKAEGPEPARPSILHTIGTAPPPVALVHQIRRLSRVSRLLHDSPPLEVEDVRVRFGGIVALDGASLTIGEAEIVGLIGPNGAGKSTLINVISGHQPASSGSVRVAGHDISGLSPDLRAAFGLSRTFQQATLFAGLTVRETVQVAMSRRWMVRFLPAMAGAPWSRFGNAATEVEADVILARFGLTPWAETLGAELSTGTRRICALACQVAAQPKVLLLDEPTAGVAQREAEAFGPLLRQVRDELDCSILIVEHDMPLLMGLCDRVYAMNAGRVIAEGTPAEIRADANVIATYLGTDEVSVNRSGRTLARSRS
jgi:ABC-type branched-subunit amino acid transport system ATPase component/ABC-type branched-subunit amino acid transport system permease subunit